MSKHRRRLDRRTAEQMLSGAPVAEGHPLNDLLAAAATPVRDGELAGEQAAVAAFRAARLAPAPQARRPSMLKTLLTAKFAAAIAVAAVAAGGVATAAATGYLPTPLGGNPTPTPAHTSAVTTSTSPSSAGDHDSHGDSPSSPDSPSPSLTGLCDAYEAGAGSDHGKALDSPAFAALITAAGGKANVDAYCAKQLADRGGQAVTPSDNGADHGNQGHDPNGNGANGNGPNGNGQGNGHADPGPGHPTGSPTTHPGH